MQNSYKQQRQKSLLNSQTKQIIALCSLLDFDNINIPQALLKGSNSPQKSDLKFRQQRNVQPNNHKNPSTNTKKAKGNIFQKSFQYSSKPIKAGKQEPSREKIQSSSKYKENVVQSNIAKLISQFLQFDTERQNQPINPTYQHQKLPKQQENKLCVSFGGKIKQPNVLHTNSQAFDGQSEDKHNQDSCFGQKKLRVLQDSKQQILQQFDYPITQVKYQQPFSMVSPKKLVQSKRDNQNFKTFKTLNQKRQIQQKQQNEPTKLQMQKQTKKFKNFQKKEIKPESRYKIGSNISNQSQSIRQSRYGYDTKRSRIDGQQTQRKSSVKSIDLSSHIKGYNKSRIKQQVISKNNITQVNSRVNTKTKHQVISKNNIAQSSSRMNTQPIKTQKSDENSYAKMYESRTFKENMTKTKEVSSLSSRKKIFNDKSNVQSKLKSKQMKDSMYSGISPSKPISISIHLPSLPPKQQLLYQSPKQKQFIREISSDIKNLIKKIQNTESLDSNIGGPNSSDYKNSKLIRIAKSSRND